jgi:hypothetical protein
MGGRVFLEDLELSALSRSELRKTRRRIGMIFQEFALVERLTVMENVLSGRLGYVPFWRSFARRYPQADVDNAFALLGWPAPAGSSLDPAPLKILGALSHQQPYKPACLTGIMEPSYGRDVQTGLLRMFPPKSDRLAVLWMRSRGRRNRPRRTR